MSRLILKPTVNVSNLIAHQGPWCKGDSRHLHQASFSHASNSFSRRCGNLHCRSLKVDSLIEFCRRGHEPLSSCRKLSSRVRAQKAQLGTKTEENAPQEEEEEEVDPDFANAINTVCNRAVRAMLSEDIQQVAQFKAEVDELGQYFTEEKHMDAALFMLVLRGMLDHKIVLEGERLTKPYKKAFKRMFDILEDSGWLLAAPEQEQQPVIDDELIPPSAMQQPL